MPELRRREATLRAELDALDTELHDAETYLKLTETLDAFRARLSANAENLTIEQRQEIVRLVVREVLLGDDDITVRHSIPVPTQRPARRFATAFTASRRLRKAIRQVFGNDVPVQRCVQHKERNVLDHLPERDRQASRRRLRRAWKETDHDIALEQLNAPGARARPRPPRRRRIAPGGHGGDADASPAWGSPASSSYTLQSTNPCESMISTVRVIHRNVKHWSSGEMCLRWTAAGMLEAESRFRKVEGYRGLAGLAVKIEHDLLHNRQLDTYTTTREATHPVTV